MAKKKDAIALFEAIQKSRQKRMESQLAVPEWMGKAPPPGQQPAAAGAGGAAAAATGGPATATASAPAAAPAAPPPVPGSPGAAPTAAPAASTAAPAAARPVAAAAAARAPRRLLRWPESAPSGEPIFAIAGERLKLSLSYVSCAGGLAILAALLVVTFALGWWGGKRSGLAARRAGDVPFNPAVAPGLGQRERQAPPPSAVRQKGKWYLVIQGLGGTKQADRDEAGRIIAFLAASGEQAGLATYKSSTGAMQYIVWSLRPFDSPGSNAAQDFARQTEALGKKYFDKHKTYDFRQRTAANKFNPWFELAR